VLSCADWFCTVEKTYCLSLKWMAEQSVCTGRAVVYYFDSSKKNWAPSPVPAYARLDIYKNTGTGGYRVIGRGIEDASTIVINSQLTKDTVYVRSQEQFHQFQDPRYLYGLNFATPADALTFGTEFEKAVAAIKGGGGAPAPPATQPKPPATPPSLAGKSVVGPPSTGPSKPPPMPPKAPPKPPPARAAAPPASDAPDDSDNPTRNALLDSIQGFSKNKLKKADTVDKSVPILAAAKPSASSESSDGGGSAKPARGSPAAAGGGDMMASIMAKRAAMQKPAEPKPVEPKPAEHKKPAPPAAKKPESKPPPLAPRVHKSVEETSVLTSHSGTSPRGSTPPSSHSSSPHNSQGPLLPEQFLLLKDEIMAEVRLELAQMKTEILNAIRGQYWVLKAYYMRAIYKQ
jgi:hypothetical protein